jgi:sarcosine oxidase
VIYDAIVIGLGAMGSATAYELARRGLRVLGLEAFSPAHQLGSSGGRSRIIRLAYFEHPDYVPLLRAAWDGWHELERVTGEELLLETGGLYAGRLGSAVLDGALESARRHELPHELLDAGEVARRFPALRLEADMGAVHEPLAGMLFPERCIETYLRLAAEHGARLHFDERVTGWDERDGRLVVTTVNGSYEAQRLVIAAGAWLPGLVPELQLPLTVERNVLFWFEHASSPELLAPDRLPVYLVEVDADHTYYGFPTLPDQGAKVARHHGGRGRSINPDKLDREVHPADERAVRDFCARHLPAANGRVLETRVCMYTNTPDDHFMIDRHPARSNVIIASPCSGHGFKFSNVVGRICADLAADGGTEFEIGFLSLARFGRMSGSN